MNRAISRRAVVAVVALALGLVLAPACTKKEEVPAPPAASKETTLKSAEDVTKETPAKEAAPAPPATPASQLAELADVAKQTFTLEKLKSMAGSLSTDDLKSVAETLVAAIQGEAGSVDKLKEQLSKLSPTDLGGMADLKKSLSEAEALLKGLQAKLAVAVDSLKAKGVDVSKYTSFLAGK